jgi:hypothetical protein
VSCPAFCPVPLSGAPRAISENGGTRVSRSSRARSASDEIRAGWATVPMFQELGAGMLP